MTNLPDNFDPFASRLPDFTENLNVPPSGNQDIDQAPWISVKGTEETASTYVGVAIRPRRLAAMAGALTAVFILLAGRAFALQIAEGEHYTALAEGNRIRVLSTPSERGLIYDRQGVPLVENQPTLSLAITPSDLPTDIERRREVITNLAKLGGITAESVIESIGDIKARGLQPVVIREDLSHQEAVKLSVETNGIPGASVAVSTKRFVRFSDKMESLGHLIGYLGRITKDEYARLNSSYGRNDRLGKAGIESFYETLLRGRFGRKEVEINAAGREVKVLAIEPPVDGSALELTIDVDVQEYLERTLKSQLSARGLRRGAAVAMDPLNGEVLALVSLPGYDPNQFVAGLSAEEYARLAEDPDEPLFPRAVTGTYPPGSTIKPIFAAAALSEGVITPRTTILSTGGITYANRWWFPDWKAGGHGPTEVTKAIADSVNTFFYYVGGGFEKFSGLGVERMTAYASRFGLGKKTGVELPGEAEGLLPDPEWKLKTKGEEWYIGDTYHFAIGQGDVLVTPLQMAAATAAIANGGKLKRPHLVRGLRDPQGNLQEMAPDNSGDPIISPEVLRTVRAGMRRTVTEGSAKELQSIPVTVAGKTGTAQWSSTKRSHAWFAGFAPYNSPEIAVAILIEEGGEGSTLAVPVARDFLAWYFGRSINND